MNDERICRWFTRNELRRYRKTLNKDALAAFYRTTTKINVLSAKCLLDNQNEALSFRMGGMCIHGGTAHTPSPSEGGVDRDSTEQLPERTPSCSRELTRRSRVHNDDDFCRSNASTDEFLHCGPARIRARSVSRTQSKTVVYYECDTILGPCE
jgi:hypothetical protein